ncbi:MAG: hypothetical protein H6594_07475 [Flavobacteriales bacterium]|nr:hypothetical protein [Flavobacteriales bacterium]
MRLLFTLAAGTALLAVQAQTVLFTEDFEGPAPAFDLNTADVGSQVGGANTWLINSSYTGGSGDVICLGIPFTYTINNTAGQPGGIGSSNGHYMHITSVEAIADGITNCCFSAADGLCTNSGSHFARMTNDVSTIGYSDVTLSFWWLCAGSNNAYGEVYSSTDGGANWSLITTPITQYHAQASWVQQSITLPGLAGQATVRFGFRFVNGTSINAQDPAFGIDDVRIAATATTPAAITTNATGSQVYCAGSALVVDYVVQGTYTAGNVFTAELSDATGSFASPTSIGSVAATSATPIMATIPPGTPPGAGYRVRVMASMPMTIGSDNGLDLTIVSEPDAGLDNAVTYCKNTGTYDLFLELGGSPDSSGSWAGPGGVPHPALFDTDADNGGPYAYVVDNGVCPADTAVVNVTLNEGANAGNSGMFAICNMGTPSPLIGFINGGDLTGIFWSNGMPISQLPTTAGNYDILYVVYGTAPCVNDTADLVFDVMDPPDAGSNGTAAICENAGPTDLLPYLGGTPDPGGSWMDPNGQAHSGILMPTSDPSGLYTYTVAGIPPCTDASAALAVLVQPCLGIVAHATSVVSIAVVDGATVRIASTDGATVPGMLRIHDTQGRTVHSSELLLDGVVRVDLGAIGQAVYIAEWIPERGPAVRQRLMLGR